MSKYYNELPRLSIAFVNFLWGNRILSEAKAFAAPKDPNFFHIIIYPHGADGCAGSSCTKKKVRKSMKISLAFWKAVCYNSRR